MRGLLLAAVLLLPSTAAAQRAARSTDVPADVQREILALEQRIGDANFACDYAFFAEIEAPEFIFTDGSGGVTTRAEDLAGESSCRPSKGSYALSDVRVMGYGDVVVFNALATTKGTNRKGEPFERKHRFTDVLVRRDGRWQLVAGHASRLP